MGPLDGVKILDLSRLLPGPFCTMILSDLGADVLKVEEADKGDSLRYYAPIVDGESIWFACINRNKKSITLNLKANEGIEIFKKLVSTYDVIVESFRPGVMERLGIDYKTLSKINERIIYCSITGYGHNNPYKDRAGHDINYVGISGILDLNRDDNGIPVIPPVQIGDIGGGGFFPIIGILSALFQREKSGKGEFIEISILDGLLTWLTTNIGEFLVTGKELNKDDMLASGSVPCYNIYQTKDGKYITVGALEDKFWINLCKVLNRDDLVKYQYAKGDEAKRVKKELNDIFIKKNRDEWLELFRDKEVCIEPVNNIEELLKHPYISYRNIIKNERFVGLPIKFSNKDCSIRYNSPKLGEHNKDILNSLGYDNKDIEIFKNKGVI